MAYLNSIRAILKDLQTPLENYLGVWLKEGAYCCNDWLKALEEWEQRLWVIRYLGPFLGEQRHYLGKNLFWLQTFREKLGYCAYRIEQADQWVAFILLYDHVEHADDL